MVGTRNHFHLKTIRKTIIIKLNNWRRNWEIVDENNRKTETFELNLKKNQQKNKKKWVVEARVRGCGPGKTCEPFENQLMPASLRRCLSDVSMIIVRATNSGERAWREEYLKCVQYTSHSHTLSKFKKHLQIFQRLTDSALAYAWELNVTFSLLANMTWMFRGNFQFGFFSLSPFYLHTARMHVVPVVIDSQFPCFIHIFHEKSLRFVQVHHFSWMRPTLTRIYNNRRPIQSRNSRSNLKCCCSYFFNLSIYQFMSREPNDGHTSDMCAKSMLVVSHRR